MPESISLPPGFEFISILINILILPALYYLFKVYLPTKLEQQKKAFDVRLEQQQIEAQAALDDRKDKREYYQSSGNVAVEVMREILREAITEKSEESNKYHRSLKELTDTIHRLGKQVDANSQSVTTLAGAIDQWRSEIQKVAKKVEL